MLHTVYLINHMPSLVLANASLYFMLHDRMPDYSSLHIFECVCFVLLPPYERNKLTDTIN